MSVRVRMRPPDLSTVAETITFERATSYRVCDDNTLELYDADEDVCAHVHSSRWDTVEMLVES